MKRFNDDNEDFKDEDLSPEGMDDGYSEDELVELNADYVRVLEKRELVEIFRLQLFQKEINYSILIKVIEYLEKSWFWRFKTRAKRLQLIIETYDMFKSLVDLDVSEEEKGE